MKVHELINKLRRLDPDMEVTIASSNIGEVDALDDVSVSYFDPDPYFNGRSGFYLEDKSDAENESSVKEVVILWPYNV